MTYNVFGGTLNLAVSIYPKYIVGKMWTLFRKWLRGAIEMYQWCSCDIVMSPRCPALKIEMRLRCYEKRFETSSRPRCWRPSLHPWDVPVCFQYPKSRYILKMDDFTNFEIEYHVIR